jgi:ADP-ribosylglycohydrolase
MIYNSTSLFFFFLIFSGVNDAAIAIMTSTTSTVNPNIIQSRIKGALYGMFAGDALASPTHWYYGGFPQIKADYGPDGITTYRKPVTNLAGSILNKSDPNGGGRLSYSSYMGREKSIIGDVINHGKLKYWDPTKSFHYHATLQAGENTLEMQLARVLMKSIVASRGRFNEDHFRKSYVDFMTTEGSHNDVYASTSHRMFFANMVFRKKKPKDCPDNDGHNVDAIDGLVLPTITALAETARQLCDIDKDDFEGVKIKDIQMAAARTAAVTRSSSIVERVSEVWADLVFAAITKDATGNEMEQPLIDAAHALGMNSPRPDRRDQMSECYLSRSIPPTLDMLSKYTQSSESDDSCWNVLLANANVGGENVHRGALLGAILGARSGVEGLHSELKDGLYQSKVLENEINEFVDAVMGIQANNGNGKFTTEL